MAKNRYLRSAYEYYLDIKRPFKGWPRLPKGQRAYPVFRSKCTGALLAAPLGWENKRRSVKLPGQPAVSKRHIYLKSLYPQTDPKGRILFLNECTGSVVSLSADGKKKYYWPRENVPPPPVRVKRVSVAVSTTTNPLPRRVRDITHRHTGHVTFTAAPPRRRRA